MDLRLVLTRNRNGLKPINKQQVLKIKKKMKRC